MFFVGEAFHGDPLQLTEWVCLQRNLSKPPGGGGALPVAGNPLRTSWEPAGSRKASSVWIGKKQFYKSGIDTFK